MKRTLRIIFMGTPSFAVASLDKIVASKHEVVAVVTSTDKKSGRGKKLRASDIKQYSMAHSIPTLQPKNLKSDEFIKELRTYKADLFVVVAFRMLPESVWSLPSLGTINLHGSLLPDYRGAAPINWAVINGDKKTGVTTFYINEKIDTGEILLQDALPISNTDTAGTVHDKMMVLGATLLTKTIDMISQNELTSTVQKWDRSYRRAPKIFKEDCRIDWNMDSTTLYNRIRGLSPYPTAFTRITNESGTELSLKIFTTEIINKETGIPGDIHFSSNETMTINTKNGALSITELQLEGKKRIKIGDFLRGFNTKLAWKALI